MKCQAGVGVDTLWAGSSGRGSHTGEPARWPGVWPSALWVMGSSLPAKCGGEK